jgi:hypothetical protein
VNPIVTPEHKAAAAELHPHIASALADHPDLATPPANWTGTSAQWLQTIMALLQTWGPTILAIIQMFGKPPGPVPAPAPPNPVAHIS